MAGIEITDEYWPVIFFRLTDKIALEDFEALFALYTRCYGRGERFASILDAGDVLNAPGPAARKFVAVKAKEHASLSRRWVLQSTVVMRNGLVRGAMTAITWLAPPEYPLSYEATIHAAVGRVRNAFQSEGRDLAPTLLRRLYALDRSVTMSSSAPRHSARPR